MSHQNIMRFTICACAALLAVAAVSQTAVAQRMDIPTVANPQTQTAMADEQTKQILLLMKNDQNGRISERDFMKFMRSEFRKLNTSQPVQADTLDTVDTNEPAHFKPQVTPSALYGK